MAATDVQIDVEGLREFRQELREMGPAAAKELQQEFKGLAKRIASRAESRYGSLYRSRRAPHVRALATQRGASVAIGSAAKPYLIGQEFGSGGGGSRATARRIAVRQEANPRAGMRAYLPQFPPYVRSPSGRGGRGYYLYPTIREAAATIAEDAGKVIDRVSARVFPEGRRG